MAFFRQIYTLTWKNLLLECNRHFLSTLLRAFVLPIAFIVFLAYAQNLFVAPSDYGIADARPVLLLADAMHGLGTSSELVLVNNGLAGGDIDKVISAVASPVIASGLQVQIASNESQLVDTCAQDVRGLSNCYAAAVFHSSPTEGAGTSWNYTIRFPSQLGAKVDIRSTRNDIEVYGLPLQHAVDQAIASLNGDGNALSQVSQYPFTSETEADREDGVRARYNSAIRSALAAAFFIAQIGVVYHLVGFMALERERGISALLEAMMPNRRRWQPRLARLLSYFLAFSIIYLPGWLVMAGVMKRVVFVHTPAGIVVGFYILSGLSLTSSSIFAATFFRRVQLSGITVTVISLALSVVGMALANSGNAIIGLTSLFLPPINIISSLEDMTWWESAHEAMNLYVGAPGRKARLPGLIYWDFMIAQIVFYLLFAVVAEKFLYSSTSQHRKIIRTDKSSAYPVRLLNFSKSYRDNWFLSLFSKRPVRAVQDLSTDISSGQITVLLGPNGSGKTTTLACIAGIEKPTNGAIVIESAGGLGICPQKNVFWDLLTVKEHVCILNALKSVGHVEAQDDIRELIRACDLESKISDPAKSLSGGQKRKLQLAMMFVGRSELCCIDEVSSGLDPLSRRKIWNILQHERGRRTILLTTHFLDEADFLADRIVVLSEGRLRGEGSSVELKQRWGGGYGITYSHAAENLTATESAADPLHSQHETIFTSNSSNVIQCVESLQKRGIAEYRINPPTIEDAFFNMVGHNLHDTENAPGEHVDLEEGTRIGILGSAWVLFRKRLLIFRRNFWPYLCALIIPPVASIAAAAFLGQYDGGSCGSNQPLTEPQIFTPSSLGAFNFVIGPSSKVTSQVVNQIASILGMADMSSLQKMLHKVDTLDQFNQYVSANFTNLMPGGIFLGVDGSSPTFAYLANTKIYVSSFTQSIFDSVLTNVTTNVQFQGFSERFQPDVGDSLQFILYFGLAIAVYPAFFTLYPTTERINSIRELQYSNGVRPFPLWLSYTLFDFVWVLLISVIVTILLGVFYAHWWFLGYLFVVFILHGLCATLISFTVSLFSKSQLSAFAFAAGGQAVMFLVYLIAYFATLTSSATAHIEANVNTAHFAIALFFPAGNLARALLVSLNIFAVTCRGNALISYPGDVYAYGGPILYLVLQNIGLFAFLIWWDSGLKWRPYWNRGQVSQDPEAELIDQDILKEAQRVGASGDALRVIHASKAFGSKIVVADVSFGSPEGEVFALLGPNGAGKTTLMSLIRGDLQFLDGRGQIFVNGTSVSDELSLARSRLGFCPQVDAIDLLTVKEHLTLYGRIKGVRDVDSNVSQVLRLMSLEPYADRLGAKLSGGYKRKLSLGIAIMGNPKVLLLDEPSSGMDAVAKRLMWKTIEGIKRGRSIILTTHSMEEADALASRAGILAKRMLALGTVPHLRQKYCDTYTVHLIKKTAPHSTDAEMETLRQWARETFPGSVLEAKSLFGQLKFSIPAGPPSYRPMSSLTSPSPNTVAGERVQAMGDEISEVRDGAHTSPSEHTYPNSNRFDREDGGPSQGISSSTVRDTFTILERHKNTLDLEYYSVSPSALEEVFLEVVGRHNVAEEGHGPVHASRWSQIRKRLKSWKQLG